MIDDRTIIEFLKAQILKKKITFDFLAILWLCIWLVSIFGVGLIWIFGFYNDLSFYVAHFSVKTDLLSTIEMITLKLIEIIFVLFVYYKLRPSQIKKWFEKMAEKQNAI